MIYEESAASSAVNGEGGIDGGPGVWACGLISGPRPGLRHIIRASRTLLQVQRAWSGALTVLTLSTVWADWLCPLMDATLRGFLQQDCLWRSGCTVVILCVCLDVYGIHLNVRYLFIIID